MTWMFIIITGFVVGLLASIPSIARHKKGAWFNIILATSAGVAGAKIGDLIGYGDYKIFGNLEFLNQNSFAIMGALLLSFSVTGIFLFFFKRRVDKNSGKNNFNNCDY